MCRSRSEHRVFATPSIKIILKALALSVAPLFAVERLIGLYEDGATCLKPVELFARGKDIGRKLSNIYGSARTSERRDDLFGDAGCSSSRTRR